MINSKRLSESQSVNNNLELGSGEIDKKIR
jgi:hypothetical protein